MRFLVLIFILVNLYTKAQNFVPNGSFENYTVCPTAAQFYNLPPWCGLGGGEDSFNKCFTDLHGPGGNGTPQTTVGFQYARTGQGFGGILLYTPDPLKVNLREYLHAPLNSSLQANKLYCGTFYVNLINEAMYCTDRVAMALTANSFACNQAMPNPQAIPTISLAPQITNPTGNLITDTLGWVEVSGTFMANGTESYLTIGNFNNDASTSSNLFNPSGVRTILFLLVDDVSLEEVFPVKAKNDTLIMQGDSVVVGNNTSEAALYSWQPTTGLSCSGCANPKASPTVTTTYTVTKTQCKAITTDEITVSVSPTGINELNHGHFIKISPNPANEYLAVDIVAAPELTGNIKIRIIDVLGREMITSDYQGRLNISFLEKGIYFVSILQGNKNLVTKKIIKE